MKLIELFWDLQDEACEVYIDNIGSFYIGRRSFPMMNISAERLVALVETILEHKNEIQKNSDNNI